MDETKRARIIRLIKNAPVVYEGVKVIRYEDLRDADLSPTYEYGDKYNDVIYVIRIAREFGYRGRAGGALHLYPLAGRG